jgi:hypothetical protein
LHRRIFLTKGFGISYKAKSLVHLISRKSFPLDILENLSSIELNKQIPPGTFSQPRASKKQKAESSCRIGATEAKNRTF